MSLSPTRPGMAPGLPPLEQPGSREEIDYTQRALLNILEDLTAEQNDFDAGQRAVLNILEDSEAEKLNLQGAQRAVLNILEDFEAEKVKVEVINRELQAEIEERQRAQDEVRSLNASLERRVTERTAEVVAANKELEAFSYSVSHDLRAPLRAMDGFSQALLEDYADKIDEEGRNCIERVRAASQRMDRLIDGILTLSRATRVEMRTAAVDLSALSKAIAIELQRTYPERVVEVIVAPGLVVNGDATLLRVALENLIGNAWKFTSKHSTARIEIGAIEDQGETAYFVRDDGAGFDMTYAGKLFGAFQRLHTPSEFEGTGIGLANVQRIVHRHGGRLWAKGEVEKGATFFFTLANTNRGSNEKPGHTAGRG